MFFDCLSFGTSPESSLTGYSYTVTVHESLVNEQNGQTDHMSTPAGSVVSWEEGAVVRGTLLLLPLLSRQPRFTVSFARNEISLPPPLFLYGRKEAGDAARS